MKPASEILNTAREQAFHIFRTAVLAADPDMAVRNNLVYADSSIRFGPVDGTLPRPQSGQWAKVHLIAFGKAACKMIQAARDVLPEALCSGHGIAVTNYENASQLTDIDVYGAGHPLPDESGHRAALTLADRCLAAQQGELVLVLISGGGSALIPCPVEGVSLSAKIAVTELLLTSGAAIQEINCVRKHLSRLKGGGLARVAFPADVRALILSDVLSDDLSSIASGPTVADDTTFAGAISVLHGYKLWRRVPESVRHYLELGRQGRVAETPKPGDPIFDRSTATLIGSNRISLNRALETSRQLGYISILYSDCMSGIAKHAAEKLVVESKRRLDKAGSVRPMAMLAGGETTVVVTGNGLGGRNQEMALAFALAAEKHQLTEPWIFLSGGTDGRDGPTDAAGGLIDSNSLNRMRTTGVNPVELLANNDAYHALKASQDLLVTGATGTNVADLQVLLFP